MEGLMDPCDLRNCLRCHKQRSVRIEAAGGKSAPGKRRPPSEMFDAQSPPSKVNRTPRLFVEATIHLTSPVQYFPPLTTEPPEMS